MPTGTIIIAFSTYFTIGVSSDSLDWLVTKTVKL